MTKFLYLSIVFISVFASCKNTTYEQYYSVKKSYLNTSYGILPGEYNFYRYQTYLSSAYLDSVYLDDYKYNFTDAQILSFLRNNYLAGRDSETVYLLDKIGKINLESFGDSNILVLDIYQGVSLLCLSPAFSFAPMGSCCSQYQNFLIKLSSDSIVIMDELNPGELKGVFLSPSGTINALLFEGFSNSQGDFNGLNGSYMYRYDLTEHGLKSKGVLNVRGGEPLDNFDTLDVGKPKEIIFKEKQDIISFK